MLAARILAVPVSLVLLYWLVFDADYRTDNIFALPDLAFSSLLLVAAFLPRRIAVPLLTVGFYFGSGVITVAAFERLDSGDTGAGVLDFVIAAAYLAAAMTLSFKVVSKVPAAADA